MPELRPTGDAALAADPFDWKVAKDGRVRIFRGCREVVVVARATAARLEGTDETGAQQLLARVTGNYRRGNERRDAHR